MGEKIELPKYQPFSGWPMIVFWAAMLVFTFHACTHMVAAGDTWVALNCGRHHLNHGVDTVEPFSANSHDAGPTDEELAKYPRWTHGIIKWWHPTGWINQNWGTHTTFYWLARTFGSEENPNLNMLIVWKFVVNILACITIYYLGRVLGANPALAAIAASFALFVGRTFLDVRPAVYSNLLTPLVLLVMALAVYKHIRYIWLMVPLAVFWCNVHGGYIYIFIALVPFIGLHLLTTVPRKWTFALLSAGTWALLYLISYKTASGLPFAPIPSIPRDPMFYFTGLAMIAAIVLAWQTKWKSPAVLYAFHAITWLILIIAMFIRMSVEMPTMIQPSAEKQFLEQLSGGQLQFSLLLILALGMGAITALMKERLICVPIKDVFHMIIASAASLVAVILFNPFHLTNLTHTFIISVSKNAESWRKVNEWHPAFEWSNPVGQETAFLIMFIIIWVVLIPWFICYLLRPRKHAAPASVAPEELPPQAETYHWPRIDLPILTVAALTVYMAIKSRRFIPMAAATACPFLALWTGQIIRMITARIQLARTGQPIATPIPKSIQRGILGLAAVTVLVFAVLFYAKFKKIYLDPWPLDSKYDSIFMRMTASNLKPHDVGYFIRENKLSGRMFNYWTEGGALAFYQQPDPNTGEIPLKLFMDGRAQAAYDHDIFILWNYLHSGGKPYQDLAIARRRPTAKDWQEIGKWLDEQMKRRNVWVVVMPSNQLNSGFVRGIQTQSNWMPAYLDDDQILLVDTQTEKGREIINKLSADQLTFPNEFSKALTRANLLLRLKGAPAATEGFENASKAFQMRPCRASAVQLVFAARRPEVSSQAQQILLDYAKDFMEHQKQYAKEADYARKIYAAMIAAGYLQNRDENVVARSTWKAANKDWQKELGDVYKNAQW